MIGSLNGEVVEIYGTTVLLNVNGVGYEVECNVRTLENLAIGTTINLVIHTDVKEDSLRLYGFEDYLDKQVFLLLMRVNGVGTKSASEILSRIDKFSLLRVIGAGDSAQLQAVRGIGKKTAERIILELKDKVAEYALGTTASGLKIEKEVVAPFEEALEALVALGFSRKDGERALGRVKQEGATAVDSGEIVKEALRYI